jgi:predicted secreted protein
MSTVPERIRTTVSTTFELHVQEIPTSGYVWRASRLPAGIELVDDGYTDAPGPAIGAARSRRFRFRARSPGSFSLSLELRREWEDAPRETRVVEVDVR